MKPNFQMALSVAAGVALFGAIIWGIRQLPSSAITSPLKTVADIAASR